MTNKQHAPRLQRVRRLFALMACGAALMQYTQPAVAGTGDIELAASHRVMAVTQGADGHYAVTFALTLENRGTSGLADLTLELRSGYFREAGPGTVPVMVDYLQSGSAVAVEWTIDSYEWVSAEADYRPMFFDGEAMDDFAAFVSFPVISEEEAGQ